MRPLAFIFGLLLVATGLRAGEILDRVVVTVNGNALLQSDWDAELRYELFMTGRSLDRAGVEDRQGALDRIIDQELLREQMRGADFKAAGADDIEKQVALLRKQYQQEHPSQTWGEGLRQYGITEDEIRSHVQLELNQLRVIDLRLRPSIQIEAGAVERYYREKVVSSSGRQAVPLAEAEPKIREILIQEKMNQLLDSWLESLRAAAKIQHYSVTSSVQASQP